MNKPKISLHLLLTILKRFIQPRRGERTGLGSVYAGMGLGVKIKKRTMSIGALLGFILLLLFL